MNNKKTLRIAIFSTALSACYVHHALCEPSADQLRKIYTAAAYVKSELELVHSQTSAKNASKTDVKSAVTSKDFLGTNVPKLNDMIKDDIFKKIKEELNKSTKKIDLRIKQLEKLQSIALSKFKKKDKQTLTSVLDTLNSKVRSIVKEKHKTHSSASTQKHSSLPGNDATDTIDANTTPTTSSNNVGTEVVAPPPPPPPLPDIAQNSSTSQSQSSNNAGVGPGVPPPPPPPAINIPNQTSGMKQESHSKTESERADLLTQIQTGIKLKKVETNDRSTPSVKKTNDVPPAPVAQPMNFAQMAISARGKLKKTHERTEQNSNEPLEAADKK